MLRDSFDMDWWEATITPTEPAWQRPMWLAWSLCISLPMAGRTNAQGVYNIRQTIVNNSLPQSLWNNLNPNPMKNGVVPLPAPLAMPSVNWVPQPRIVNVALVTNSLQMSFQTVPGYAYTVQYSASLTATNTWTSLASTNGSGSLTFVTVADPAPSSTSRFYRLVRQPAP